jgi:aminomethyltransferase
MAGNSIGRVTSGGFGPSVGAPIAMGYVNPPHATEGGALALVVRDVPRPARVARLPFVPTGYYRAHPRPPPRATGTRADPKTFSGGNE